MTASPATCAPGAPLPDAARTTADHDCATSEGAVTVPSDADVQGAARPVSARRLRRLAVVDGGSAVGGVLARADLARAGDDRQTGDVVQGVPADAG